MEEKLKELIIAAEEFTEKSDKCYAELDFNFGIEEITISIRDKNSFEYVETREIYLDKVDLRKFDELISFIEKYEA